MSEKFQTESQGSTFYIPPPPPIPPPLRIPTSNCRLLVFLYKKTYLTEPISVLQSRRKIAADQKHSAPASAKKVRITGYGKARNFHTMDYSNVQLNTVVD